MILLSVDLSDSMKRMPLNIYQEYSLEIVLKSDSNITKDWCDFFVIEQQNIYYKYWLCVNYNNFK